MHADWEKTEGKRTNKSGKQFKLDLSLDRKERCRAPVVS